MSWGAGSVMSLGGGHGSPGLPLFPSVHSGAPAASPFRLDLDPYRSKVRGGSVQRQVVRVIKSIISRSENERVKINAPVPWNRVPPPNPLPELVAQAHGDAMMVTEGDSQALTSRC